MMRTFGWIQNPGRLDTLKNVVAIFQPSSDAYNELICTRLPLLKRNGLISKTNYDEFMTVLQQRPLKIDYKLLKGKGSSRNRKNAKCTGIIQSVVDAQKSVDLIDLNGNSIKVKKPYTDDWTADGFLRWAISTGLLIYDNNSDTCCISLLGKELVRAEIDSLSEKEAYETALLSYPPVNRVLEILSDMLPHTKFEIGRNLGFCGEKGFTSIPQGQFLAHLESTSDPAVKKSVRSNMEGDADKYARMIANWCVKMGWVKSTTKNVIDRFGNSLYSSKLQAWTITVSGLAALRKSRGNSSNSKIPKNVFFEMLATKAPDAIYLRHRRATLIMYLSQKRSLKSIRKHMLDCGYDVDISTILDDLKGFSNIGLSVENVHDTYHITDNVVNLIVPEETVTNSNVNELKDKVRSRLKTLDHRYLILIDLAYSDASTKSKKNADAREFELETVSLFTDELEFDGLHLGDSDKPDSIITYAHNGTIIDNKSYKNGFNVDRHCADEMMRYIMQNNRREDGIPSNEWWKLFGDNITSFSYLFVTSFLRGRFEDNLSELSKITHVNGGAIGVDNLLYLAEDLKTGVLSYEDFYAKMQNCELICIER